MKNPITEIITTEQYEKLQKEGLINTVKLRDFTIRSYFKAERMAKKKPSDIMESIQDEHPYLQLDTIRKICYGIGSK